MTKAHLSTKVLVNNGDATVVSLQCESILTFLKLHKMAQILHGYSSKKNITVELIR